MNPKFSIVILCYNRERYIREAIESVLSQSEPNFELIAWDDGSSDNSLNILYEYSQRDNRIKLVSTPHSGYAYSLRNALNACVGKYIGCVDSDDILMQDALLKTGNILDTMPSVGMVYTNYYLIDEMSKIIGSGSRNKIVYSKEEILKKFMTFHFRLVRKSIYEKVGGITQNKEMAFAPDYDLCLKMSEVTEIYHLEEHLYKYRYHSESMSILNEEEQNQSAIVAINNAKIRRKIA